MSFRRTSTHAQNLPKVKMPIGDKYAALPDWKPRDAKAEGLPLLIRFGRDHREGHRTHEQPRRVVELRQLAVPRVTSAPDSATASRTRAQLIRQNSASSEAP